MRFVDGSMRSRPAPLSPWFSSVRRRRPRTGLHTISIDSSPVVNQNHSSGMPAVPRSFHFQMRQTIARGANHILGRFGLQVSRLETLSQPASIAARLPGGAEEYLQADNPRLIELKQRSKRHPIAGCHSVWNERYLAEEVDLRSFRSDNAYVWQTRNMRGDTSLAYTVTAQYCKDIDELDLFSRLGEDGLFGAITFPFDDRLVSRDLLDSILELNFLERHLRISEMPAPTFLDIGAGYGRLGHRLARGFPHINAAFCTDGIPTSTFLCEFYLKFRRVVDRARAIPIYDIEDVLGRHQIDVATNIESFTECTIDTIKWWLDLITKNRTRYLMVVPDYRDSLVSRELDRSTIDFGSLIEARGFDLIASEPIYGSSRYVSEQGLYPDRAHVLFRNRNA